MLVKALYHSRWLPKGSCCDGIAKPADASWSAMHDADCSILPIEGWESGTISWVAVGRPGGINCDDGDNAGGGGCDGRTCASWEVLHKYHMRICHHFSFSDEMIGWCQILGGILVIGSRDVGISMYETYMGLCSVLGLISVCVCVCLLFLTIEEHCST